LNESPLLNELPGTPPARLDVLLYAHDGRGLGHASRTVAIGMALRRLYPRLRVLFVTGASISASLIGRSGLDWIKLPSYASSIENGISSGITGPTNLSKFDLREYRAGLLREVVASFKPRVALVDHSPTGKREELIPALEIGGKDGTTWILGLRAVPGNPKNFWTERNRSVFNAHYHSIFWYGDRMLLGDRQVERIRLHFGQAPVQLGYVSRLYETLQLGTNEEQPVTCTVSLPWLGRSGLRFIEAIKSVVALRGQDERWRIFINDAELVEVTQMFCDMSNVRVEPVGQPYVESLVNSRVAIIYGGYNSLMDVATAGVPALVVLRGMKDREQQEHLQRLSKKCPGSFITVEEQDVEAEEVSAALTQLLNKGNRSPTFTARGSEAAARHIHSLLQEQKNPIAC
jgi:predicted glycosyltransferase